MAAATFKWIVLISVAVIPLASASAAHAAGRRHSSERRYPTHGIDVSHHQGHIKWTKLPSQGTFFIFPYDSYDEPALAHLVALGFLGARAGVKGGPPNTPDSLDDFRLTYDVYGPGFSRYRQQGPCATAGVAALQLWNQAYDVGGQHYTEIPIECRQYVISAYVDEIVATGKS